MGLYVTHNSCYNLEMPRTNILFFLCLAVAVQALASSPNKDIDKLKATIVAQKQKRHNIEKAFKQADELVNQLNHNLKHTHTKLKQQHTSIQHLDAQKTILQEQLKNQQAILSQALIQAYKVRKNPTIQMIINDQDPEKINRMLHYYGSLNDKHIHAITALKQTLDNLQSTAEQMKAYQEALQQTLNEQRKQQKHLSHTRAKKTSILNSLEASIQSKQQTLHKLQEDKQELDSIVKTLKKKAVSNTFTAHSLRWPTRGKIVQHFGKSIQKSELKTHGIVIQSREGTPVHAVADGKVIFAKWMSGFGLLMIVEHDNGYLSLYGRNDSLDAEVNDLVKAGDQIASVGHSGAFSESGLYFAIRQGDKPVDPENLLARSG